MHVNSLHSAAASPPLSIGGQATLACIWEATAPKPGNVYRGADFDDVTYADFVTAAVAIGPIVERAAERGFGDSLVDAVGATNLAVGTNTNLGTLLLLIPLAAVDAIGPEEHLAQASQYVRDATVDDTQQLYQAISSANAGGLGSVTEADVADAPPAMTVHEVMQLAAGRDTIANELTTGFDEVSRVAKRIESEVGCGQSLADAIVIAALDLHARVPDSLIARKLGVEVAEQASRQAAAVLNKRQVLRDAYEAALGDFDFWLRADGHRRNPGTTADVVAAALFVLLRNDRLTWPLRFYGGETE